LFFGALAAWHGLHGQTTSSVVLAALAMTIGPLGLLWPAAVRPIFVGWLALAFPIGWLVTLLTLAFVYYLILTPLALWFRLIGRDPLTLRKRPNELTYWRPKPQPADKRSYFRQF
jgi:hypothetical protein